MEKVTKLLHVVGLVVLIALGIEGLQVLHKSSEASGYAIKASQSTAKSAAALKEFIVRLDYELTKDPQGLAGVIAHANTVTANLAIASAALPKIAVSMQSLSADLSDQEKVFSANLVAASAEGVTSMQAVTSSVKTFQETIANFDQRLNGDSGTMAAATASVNQSRTLLEAGTRVVTDFDQVVKDPSLADSLHKLDQAMSYLASASGHLDKSIGYVEYDLTPRHLPFWQAMAQKLIPFGIGQLIPIKVDIRNTPSVSVVSTVAPGK